MLSCSHTRKLSESGLPRVSTYLCHTGWRYAGLVLLLARPAGTSVTDGAEEQLEKRPAGFILCCVGLLQKLNTAAAAALLLLFLQTTINIRLRYPLMGGWKTDFTLGECIRGSQAVCWVLVFVATVRTCSPTGIGP